MLRFNAANNLHAKYSERKLICDWVHDVSTHFPTHCACLCVYCVFDEQLFADCSEDAHELRNQAPRSQAEVSDL